jgi:hypothetical protein
VPPAACTKWRPDEKSIGDGVDQSAAAVDLAKSP